jgi:hypothetical protein
LKRSNIGSVSLVSVLLLTTTYGQSLGSQRRKDAPGSVQITKFLIAKPVAGSGYETGPLYISYSDGTEVVQTLPPLKRSTDKEVVFNAVGFADVELARDQQTLGWTVDVQNCCTSYSIPISVVVFRNKRVLHTFEQGQMVWSWMFLDDGRQVAVVFGPTHGPEVGDYRLYEVKTGSMVSEVWGDTYTQSLKSSAPDWAKELQNHLDHPSASQ